MKFYKLALTVLIPILVISALVVAFGVQVTFKASEVNNNIYYTDMAYNMIKKYIKYEVDAVGGIYRDQAFYQLKNDEILANSSKDIRFYNEEVKTFKNLMGSYGFKYYYIENIGMAPCTNAPYELATGFLNQNNDKYSIQIQLYEYDGEPYLGLMKNMYASYFSDNQKTYLVVVPLRDKLNESIFNTIGKFQAIELMIGDQLGSNEDDILQSDGGRFNISNENYNEMFIPVVISGKTLANLVVKMDKPEVIKNLRNQTIVVLMIVFIILLIASFVATLVLRRIAKQIEKTVDKVNSIANGQYDMSLEMDGIHEIKRLSSSINKLSDTINEQISELRDKNEETLNIMIEALDATDSYTMGHSDRVAKYAQVLGEALNYEKLEILEKAALVHDVGKITIPEQILNKKGPLTDAEFQVIQGHSEMGFRILHKASAFSEVEELVLYHHEKYDGTGYPKGLKGSEIPMGAQILSVADVYDALTSNRPYRKALSHEEAVKLITGSMESQFAPRVLEGFMEVSSVLQSLKEN